MIILSSFLNSIVFTFVSWTIGLLLNNVFKDMVFYSKFSNFNFTKSDSINKAIGMNIFKWMVTHTFFKYFNQKLKFETRPSITQLKAIRKEMTYSEISHLIGFLFMIVIITMKLLQGQIIQALVLFVFNIIFNLYPSLLQQQNKIRIDRIVK